MSKDALETIPEVDMMTVIVDHKATDGGITINGTKYIGEVTVKKDIARQIITNMQEYAEVKNKMFDPSQKIRNKNGFVTERAYLADPAEHTGNPRFSMEFGLLDPWQWQFVAEPEKERLRKLKTSIYGYTPNK